MLLMTNEEYKEFLKTYKPKNFKYKFIFTDNELQEDILKSLPAELASEDDLDTIQNDELVKQAMSSDFVCYGNNVKKAKEPTSIEEGIFISKMMVTKTGKPLLDVQTAHFIYENNNYIAIKFVYEKFYILEIFIIIS